MTRTIKQLLFGILLSLLIIVIAYLTSPLFRTTPIKIELNQNKISTLVVAHHDLVKHERSRIFREVAAKEKYRDVILVSPDHFNSGINSISTTNKTWHLTNSIILPDSDKINQLEKNLVTNQESAFEREHGITNILNDISTNFPDANIIPLIIKANTENDKIQKLNENLIKICPSNCLMINSIDFSHYQTGTLAEIHDSLSLRALENLDEKLAWQSETDSPQALTLATFWAKSNSTMNFHLGYHSNSAEIFQEPDSESTSYILGWYEERQQRSTNEISFMFAGDAMFGRGVYYKFPKLEKAFENLGDRFFWGTDVSMLNLEGPISKQNIFPNPAPDNLIFNFPPQTISVLKWLHINTVGLANNHTLNQGMSGFNNTIQLLKTNKINSIGNPGCDNDASLQTFASGKKKMSIIAINALECSSNIDEMIRSQKNLSNYVIIFVHWGNEYEKTHSITQERFARLWINHGADLIIGTHPHTIQDAEIYEGKPIFYSIGNFIFDQTFSENTQKGLVITGLVSDNKIILVPIPISLKNMQPVVIRGQEKLGIINEVKKQMGLDTSESGYGYDKIDMGI